jgi:hypothetical protein
MDDLLKAFGEIRDAIHTCASELQNISEDLQAIKDKMLSDE